MTPRILSPGPQQPVMNIATPINDVQLLALLAASVYGKPHTDPDDEAYTVAELAVCRAVELLAQSVVAQRRLSNRTRQLHAETQANAFADQVEKVAT